MHLVRFQNDFWPILSRFGMVLPDFLIANVLWGRCQHPITKNSGTGDFEGGTERLDFKDNVVDHTFPYRNHLR